MHDRLVLQYRSLLQSLSHRLARRPVNRSRFSG